MTKSTRNVLVITALGLGTGCATDPLAMLPPLERSLIQTEARARSAAEGADAGAVSVEHMLDSIRQQYGAGNPSSSSKLRQPVTEHNDG